MDKNINYILRAELHLRMSGKKLETYIFERIFHLRFLKKSGVNATFYDPYLKIHFENKSAISYIYEIEIDNTQILLASSLEKSTDFIRRINYMFDWIQIKVNRNGKVISIENKEELTEQWEALKKTLFRDYESEIMEYYLNIIDQRFNNGNDICGAIYQYLNFGLLFPQIPKTHSIDWENKRLIEFSEYEDEKFEEQIIYKPNEDNGKRTYIINLKQLDDSKTETERIKTQRIMYYVEAIMTGITSHASSLSVFTNEYNTHNITFKGLPSINIDHMHNIGNKKEDSAFKDDIKKAYAASLGSSKSPYCVIIGYTDHLAVKEENQEIPPVSSIGGSVIPVIIDVTDSTGKIYALWNDIVPTDDWFVDCYFIKSGGTNANKINIEKAKCTPIHNPKYAIGYCDSVSINVSSLPAETGTITLKVNWVNRMRGGLSFDGTNIVAICTKAWWNTISGAAQCQIIIHEIGHQLGMVANGSGKLPAKTIYHYDSSKGHVGNHCHFGIPVGQAHYNSNGDAANSRCVMYGATNGKTAFCTECSKALKKVDLAAGV